MPTKQKESPLTQLVEKENVEMQRRESNAIKIIGSAAYAYMAELIRLAGIPSESPLNIRIPIRILGAETIRKGYVIDLYDACPSNQPGNGLFGHVVCLGYENGKQDVYCVEFHLGSRIARMTAEQRYPLVKSREVKEEVMHERTNVDNNGDKICKIPNRRKHLPE